MKNNSFSFTNKIDINLYQQFFIAFDDKCMLNYPLIETKKEIEACLQRILLNLLFSL